MSLEKAAEHLAFRFPRRVEGCGCPICARLGVAPGKQRENNKHSNVPEHNFQLHVLILAFCGTFDFSLLQAVN